MREFFSIRHMISRKIARNANRQRTIETVWGNISRTSPVCLLHKSRKSKSRRERQKRAEKRRDAGRERNAAFRKFTCPTSFFIRLPGKKVTRKVTRRLTVQKRMPYVIGSLVTGTRKKYNKS